MKWKVFIASVLMVLFFSKKVFAANGAMYSQATADTIGVFYGCKLNVMCRIKAPTNVAPSFRHCKEMSSVTPLIRSLEAAAEGQNLGIKVSGFITIYPPDGKVILGVGQSHQTINEWGQARCGSLEGSWPINDISVMFTKPISKRDLPVRILAFGRGRANYIAGFQNVGRKDISAANIIIDGSIIDDSPDVIEPSCTVIGSAVINHGKHTPTTIIDNIASSSPVSLKCNGNVSVSIDIKGNHQVYGEGANWTACGSGACEVKLNGGNKLTVNGGENLIFSSTWHSLGKPIESGQFTGAAVATFKFN